MNRDIIYERKFQSNSMFPINVCVGNRIDDKEALDCHWHNELEFLVVTDGKAMFQVGTTHHEVSSGQAIFINSSELHAGFPIGNSSCVYNVIIFTHSLIYSSIYDDLQNKYFQPILTRKLVLPSFIAGSMNWEKQILSHISTIIDLCCSKPYGYELSVKAFLYLIFHEIISSNKEVLEVKDSEDSLYSTERLKMILNYIQDNYFNKIAVKDLASCVNMSEGHLYRFFKKMVKKTPTDYINSYRVHKAASLLKNSEKKIVDIAMDTGFDSCSYFINTFKHYMNTTPSEYRKMNA